MFPVTCSPSLEKEQTGLGAGAVTGKLASVLGQAPMQDSYAQRHRGQFDSRTGLSDDIQSFIMGGREKMRPGPPVDTYTLLPQPAQQPSRVPLVGKRLPPPVVKSSHNAGYGREEKPPFHEHTTDNGYGTMRNGKDNGNGSRATSSSSYLQKRAEIVGRRFVSSARTLSSSSSSGGVGSAVGDPVPAAAPVVTPMVVQDNKIHEQGSTILVRSAGSRGGGVGVAPSAGPAGFANAAGTMPPAGYAPLGGGGVAEQVSDGGPSYLPAVGNGPSSTSYGSIWGGVPRMLTQLLKGGIGRSVTPRPAAAAAAAALPIGGATVDLDQLTGNNSFEVFQQMKRDEGRNMVYEPDAAYLEHRRRLVGWMSAVGDKLKMRYSTMHVGICFVDRIFQRRLPSREKWQMLAVSCLQVAAKYEEAEENVPAVTQLTRASGIQLTVQTVQKWEVAALEGLGWALTCIVPLHFIEYYQSRGILFYGDFVQGKPLTVKSQVAPQQMRKYTQFFAHYIMVQEYSFRKYAPSYLSAVIVYTSRYAMSVNPVWRQELTDLVGYDESSIYTCFHQLWRSYRDEFPGAGVTSFGGIPDPPIFENSPRQSAVAASSSSR